MPERADAVVVGGGPVGLAAAVALAGRGLRVTLLEGRRPPVDAACGEGLLPDGVAALRALGVVLPADGGVPFTGIRFVDGVRVAEGRFPSAPGLGVRRTTLHRALVDRAAAAGVDLRWGERVEGLAEGGVVTAGRVVRARWIVGADGRASRVRQWAGLEGRPARRRRIAVRRHLACPPWTDRVEVHWADGAEAYVTPVGPESVGVALLAWGERADFDRLLARFPALEARLGNAAPISRDRGAALFHRRARAVVRGRVLLVGDATGCLDPISGEGLALGFAAVRLLAEALADGAPDRYARELRRLRAHPRRLTALLVEASARPWLRRRMVAALAGQPGLMSRFLALKTAGERPRLLGRDGLGALTLAALAHRGGR